ncbi:MAG TPA: threonine synthase [Candidatus Competibacteraceae bacterium]|nr:threonine synthase [Candidatus Competibacteraceae bacterium]HRZ04969.1 threonine synthase [Candidatus Competibacteraceae bacterium]HSA46380.1 threonine synthase [Candidatus Competibacteraceae bacterium]
MRYVSTRGDMAPATFSDILLGGLAPDGGLTLPEAYPVLTPNELARWRGLSYPELAFAILRQFADDLPVEDLRALIDKTYTVAAFRTEAITPVTPLSDGVWLLGLSNGPTLAFKDIALQLLGNLFEYALLKTGGHLNILGATSGDTGSSAEYALRGKRGIRVFMLSPHQKMSRFQTAQMFSLQDPNIFNIAVRGVFDDCQDVVKAVSNDAEFKARYAIGTVNSINWARVAAQIVYYFKGWLAVTTREDQEVSFAVPSGNFGNICAGYIAKRMGLPIRRLILATNENNVLDEFFRTGVYRVRATDQVTHTSSPSMDISKASNFERFIFEAVGRDPAVVRELWRQVEAQGSFDLSGTPYFQTVRESGFVTGSSTHQNRMATIRRVYQESGMIIDTHTADGVKVGLEYREEGVPLLCLETALPVKFEDSIIEALGRSPERPAGYEQLETQPQRFEVMDKDVVAIKASIARHGG